MTRLILFLLWVGVTVSTEVDLQKRIIGGRRCSQNERQYHVKLSNDPTGNELLCGGSLISDQWILTAAHCLEPKIYAVLGVHPGPGQVVEITAPPVIFKDKDVLKNDRTHDIMLLKLPSPTNIQPVGFPDCGNSPRMWIVRQTKNTMVQIAGYAATVAGPSSQRVDVTSGTLHCANIQVVDCQGLRNTLRNNYPMYYSKGRYTSWFCGQTPGVDACPGDSGGGVVYQQRIYGVISFTGDPHFACREPVGFVDLCHQPYFEWIKQTIASSKKCWWCG